jgi:raffinose/stachyose/melibiose transport system substrate-binding protein
VKQKRFFVWAILLAVFLLVPAGCSSGERESGNSGGATPSGQGAPGAGQQMEVTMWSWTPIPRTMEKMIKSFEEKHPDIKINFTNYNYSPEYLSALAAGAGSNTLPDIIGLQPGSLTQQYRSYLIPLQDFAKQTWGDNWQDKFYKVDVDQLQLGNPEGDVNVYILPAESQIINVWYNKKIFNDLGLTPPKSWDDLVQASKKLAENGIAPMYQGAADGWQNVNVFLMLASQTAPGEIYKADDGQAPWTSPGLVKAMEKWKSMFVDGIFQVGALSNHAYPDGVNQFIAGRVGMMALGSWWMQEYTAPSPAPNVANWVFDNFYLPPVEEGGKPTPPIGGVDFGFGITKNAKNPEAAWKVLESFIAGEGIQEAMNDLNNLPAFKGIMPQNIPEQITNQFKAYLDVLDSALNQRLKYPEVQNALENALAGVAAGDLEPRAALERVQQATDEFHGNK